MSTISSSSAPPPHRRDMLHRLPDELLIEILELAPSLSALWSLINSSRRLAAMFLCYGAQITETVLRNTLPQPTQGLVKAVLQLRSAHYPSSLAQARHAPSLRPGSPIGVVAPDVVRGVVRQAHKVMVLAHECLRYYIQSCTRMRADELADPAIVAGVASLQTPGWKRPAGRRQQLHDTGAPMLVEERLVVLNLWRLQYYFDVRAALAAGRLEWSAEDREAMQRLSVPRFHHLEFKSYKREQLETVTRYVETAWLRWFCADTRSAESLSAGMVELPCPATARPFDLAYAPSPRLGLRPEFKPRGWAFVTGIPGDTDHSPLYGVTLSTYRKYGFAVFHDKRMVDLGLLPP